MAVIQIRNSNLKHPHTNFISETGHTDYEKLNVSKAIIRRLKLKDRKHKGQNDKQCSTKQYIDT